MKRTHVFSTMFAVTLFAGCLGSDEPSESPIARFAASDRSVADLGVTSWEVLPDGADTRVVGYGDGSARLVEAILRRDAATAEERVRIEGVFPEQGTVEITNAGGVEGTASDALRTLAIDLNADLGKAAKPLALPVPPGDGLGTASSELGLIADKSGVYPMGWNLWGYCHHPSLPETQTACRGTNVRHHAEAFADGGSYWSWDAWVSGSNNDCQANFTMCVGAGRWDNFRWSVHSEKKNLAVGMPAIQSTTEFGGAAQRAVDGITYGGWDGLPQYGMPPSVTHSTMQAQPWWQVDLGAAKTLGTIVLFNRTDCCMDRLADVDILFSLDGINFTIATQTFGPQSTASRELAVSGMARFVRVQLRGTNYLSLAEVQVFGP